ncbi:hypothetical protein BJX68DRAFT_31346 [Aspergillus pseudodeflectus]|uniref:Uncharacterized protein n=1 Tax=Aspergillus pseudodeflectus TaxID=176178 RepID=A0ABR4KQW2_9EURO
MAYYSRANSDVSQSSSSGFTKSDYSSKSEPSSKSESSSLASDAEHPLTRLSNTLKSSDYPKEHHSVERLFQLHRQDLNADRTREQFLLFTCVPPSAVDRLASDKSRVSRFVRINYNTTTHCLITKTMPAGAHEEAIRYTDVLIFKELQAMQVDEEVEYSGSTTITIGDWVKEADSSWGPFSANHKPSLVLEVGNSETDGHLTTVAHAWLECAGANTVLTIAISQDSPKVDVKNWVLVPNVASVTRASPGIARCTSSLTISKVGTSTTIIPGTGGATTITIPFDKILERDALKPSERNLVLTESMLKRLAERIWHKQSM